MKHHEQTPSAQKEFAKNVNGLVAAFQEAGNPFLEKTNDLIAMDSKNIANETAVENFFSQLPFEGEKDKYLCSNQEEARQKRGKSFAIILLACRLLHYNHQMETSE